MPHDVNQSEKDVAAQVRSALVDRISSERYDLWISQGTQWSWVDETLRITFPNEFSCQLAQRMLARDISRSVNEVVGFEARINYGVSTPADVIATAMPRGQRNQVAASVSLSDVHSSETRVTPRAVTEQRAASSKAAGDGDRLLSQRIEITEQFVQGPSNHLAWTTANLVIEDPGQLSPVLLHGPNGCGKSYLAASIAERLRISRRMRRVVHMSSEQFTNDFMEGLRGGGLPMFRRKYRDVEALILDDIQFFINKKSTIAELKHTMDNLLRLGKQVVLTADRAVNELNALGTELIGRLRGGMVTPIYPLDEETRTKVLRRHFNAAHLELGDEIVRQLASRTAGDGRVLSGIAKRLIAVSALHGGNLSWDDCWNAVFDLVQATQPVVRIADIERAVCGIFGLESNSLKSTSKSRSVSQPRMLAMFLARKYTPAAYKEIGEYFGKRRHSTVISAEKTVEAWLSENAATPIARGLTVRDALRHVEAQLQVG